MITILRNILIPICLLTATAHSKIVVDIDKALERKLIKAEVICKGGLSVDYKMKNQTKDSLQVVIPAGWRMNSVKEEYQDILVTHEQILAMKQNEQKSFVIKGYCCEADHAGPVQGAKYETGKMAAVGLMMLARYLNDNKTDENTQQYAVWSVSNNKPTANITCKNDSLATLLRNFVAGIKGEPIPWYTLRKIVKISTYGDIHEYPIELKAKVDYHVDKECYAWFYVTDSLGNKQGIIVGQWLKPGANEYAVNVNMKDFKKGKYKIVLASREKEFISKEFEI